MHRLRGSAADERLGAEQLLDGLDLEPCIAKEPDGVVGGDHVDIHRLQRAHELHESVGVVDGHECASNLCHAGSLLRRSRRTPMYRAYA